MKSQLAIAVGASALLATSGAVGGAVLAGVVSMGPAATAAMAALGGIVMAVAAGAAALVVLPNGSSEPVPRVDREPIPPDEETTEAAMSPLVVQLERLATSRHDEPIDIRGIPRDLRGAVEQLADRMAEDHRRNQGREARVRQLQVQLDRLGAQIGVAEGVRDAFLARMSHELRTPLNAILGYVELLDEELEDEMLREDLRKVRSSALQLHASVTTVLDLTQLEANSYEVLPEAVDLPELMRHVSSSVAAAAAANQNQLNTHIPAGLSVNLDRRMLQSILYNLTSNACKYTNQGSVEVQVEEETSRIRVVVSDTGIGMTERQIREAFRPFHQADDSSTRRYDGAGLGLAVVRGFAEAMGGKVEIRSALGRGSRVEVSLPRQCDRRVIGLGEDDPTMLVR